MVSGRGDDVFGLLGSLVIHAVIGIVLFVALSWKEQVEPLDVAGPVIEAVLVDFTAKPLPDRAPPPKPAPPKPKPEEPKPSPEPQPPPPEEVVTPPPAEDRIDQEKIRLAAEAQERAEREQEERRKREQIELERQQAELTRMEQERQKQLDDIRKQREEAERKRRLEEQKLAQLADANKLAEAEKQRAAERQRMADLAEQEKQRAGTEGKDDSLLSRYKLALNATIDRNWRRPDTLREGFRCNVLVRQIIGGEVIAVDVSACAADPLVLRSIEAAVQREPLPYEGFESVFSPRLTIPFCYPQEICIQ